MIERVGDVVLFKRRQPELPAEQPAAPEALPVQVGQLVLQTFEHRRNQLTTKSTICATAASGVIVLVIQIFLVSPATRVPVRLLGLAALICAALALIEDLNVIKKLSKRTRSKRSRKHILFFGTFVDLQPDEAHSKFVELTEEQYVHELAVQAVELSRNLRSRYDALGKAHRWLTAAVAMFVATLAVQQVFFIFFP